MTGTRTEPGSFRDRESRVFERDGRIFRGLSPTALAQWERLSATRFFRAFSDRAQLPRTVLAEVDDVELRSVSERFVAALEHDVLPFVSYPYEWSFSMLRDAALLTLDLLEAALAEGMTLKDASAYNVQFRGAVAQFIDVGSFEGWREGEAWVGYRQFCQLFLYPLMLQAYRGVAFQPWLRGSIDGIAPEEMAGLVSSRDLVRAGVLGHVVLQARLGRATAGSTKSVRSDLAASGFKKEMILHNARSLRKLVAGLRPTQTASEWSDYTQTRSYDAADLEAKRAFVKGAASASAAKTVWDLGCNTGEFSLLAAETADSVVAMDGDALAVDRLYQKLAADRNDKILPLVVRLNDPSPAIGWRNRERRELPARGAPDLVLALALAHHLVITGNIPVAALLDWLAELGAFLVIEFVSKADPMVEKLLLNKIDNYDDWEKPAFEAALEARFEVRERLALESGTRFLYFARSRATRTATLRSGRG